MHDPDDSKPATQPRTGRRRAVIWTMVGVLAAGSIFAAQAIADSRPVQHLRQFVADGGMPEITPAQFPHGPRFGGGPRSPFADMTEEEIDRMIASVEAQGLRLTERLQKSALFERAAGAGA